MGERRVEDGESLANEADSCLGSAFVHLHALKPYLDEGMDTWWSWSLVGCMMEYYNDGRRFMNGRLN